MLPTQLPALVKQTLAEGTASTDANTKPGIASAPVVEAENPELAPFSEHLLVASTAQQPGTPVLSVALPVTSVTLAEAAAGESPAAGNTLPLAAPQPAIPNQLPAVTGNPLPDPVAVPVATAKPAANPELPLQAPTSSAMGSPMDPAASGQPEADLLPQLTGRAGDGFVGQMDKLQTDKPGVVATADTAATGSTTADRPVTTLPAAMVSSAASSSSASLSTPPPLELGSARFGDTFATQISWLVNDGARQASLRMNPPELGPVEVRINLSDSEASISFAAQHESVREAIESALPKLRTMLAQSGLSLGDVNVSTGSPDQQGGEQADGTASPASATDTDGADTAQSSAVAQPLHRGLIDQYV